MWRGARLIQPCDIPPTFRLQSDDGEWLTLGEGALATDAGRRMLTQKMSFVPYPGSTTGLLWWDAADRQRRAA